MGGQPGKPKPIGNPPIRYEPQRPPIEEIALSGVIFGDQKCMISANKH
jgi:hypothetical protein